MSTTSKKPPIGEESKKRANDLPTTEDLQIEYDEYIRQKKTIEQELQRNRKLQVNDVIYNTDSYLNEIEERNKKTKDKDIQYRKTDMVNEIVENYGNKFGKPNILYAKSYDEVFSIYSKVFHLNKKTSWFHKIIQFLIGL